MSRRRVVLIDGYNVIHRNPGLAARIEESLESARNGLIMYCAGLFSRRTDVQFYQVVFDGESSIFNTESAAAQGVKIIFTETGESADSRILKLLNDAGDIYEYTVVSDDEEVRRGARAAGAKVLTVVDFTGMREKRGLSAGTVRQDLDDKNTLTPGQRKAINDSLRREWGIDPNE